MSVASGAYFAANQSKYDDNTNLDVLDDEVV